MKKLIVTLLILMAMADSGLAQSQGSGSAPTTETTASNVAYKVDFTFRELQDNKVTNTRSYSVLSDGQTQEIKMGSRVPVVTNTAAANTPSQVQYLDIGTNIKFGIHDRGDNALLTLSLESSGFALPDEANKTLERQPVIRQLRSAMSSVVVFGKPTIIATLDDPATPRRYQIEVNVNRLK